MITFLTYSISLYYLAMLLTAFLKVSIFFSFLIYIRPFSFQFLGYVFWVFSCLPLSLTSLIMIFEVLSLVVFSIFSKAAVNIFVQFYKNMSAE